MAGLAEFYNTKMLLSQCIEYVLKEEVTMKVEDVQKYPNVFIGIMEKRNKELDIVKNKLQEVNKTLKEKEKEIENLNLKIAYGDDNGDFIFNSMDNDYTTDDDDRSWDV